MDTRLIDEGDPLVTFDLLKEWALNTFGRQTGAVGSAWVALADALRQSAYERARDMRFAAESGAELDGAATEAAIGNDAVLELTERKLRQCLASAYLEQDATMVSSIVEWKLKSDLSFFHRAGYTNKIRSIGQQTGNGMAEAVQGALCHWNWYLHCLSFEAAEFSRDGGGFHGGMETLVCMPLDEVDLQMLALMFGAQITVTSHLHDPWRFHPDERGLRPAIYSVHLLNHRNLWAPLLLPRLLGVDSQQLEGAIVEIGQLPGGPLQHASHKTAVLHGYDSNLEAYMVSVEWVQAVIPIEPCHIKLIFQHRTVVEATGAEAGGTEAAEIVSGAMDGETPKAAFQSIRGIQAASLEFHIMHELVRRIGSDCLQELLRELAGRGISASNNATNSWDNSRGAAGARARSGVNASLPLEALPTRGRQTAPPSRPRTRRMPLEEAVQSLERGEALEVTAPSAVGDMSEKMLSLKAGSRVSLSAVHRRSGNKIWLYGTVTADVGPGSRGWCEADHLCIFAVDKEFPVDATWENAESYLQLKMGEVALVKSRFDDAWDGWAYGSLFGTDGKGIFPLDYVRPCLLRV